MSILKLHPESPAGRGTPPFTASFYLSAPSLTRPSALAPAAQQPPSSRHPSSFRGFFFLTSTSTSAQLVAARTGMVNSVRGWLRTQLLKTLRGTRRDNFPKRIRELALGRPEGLPEHIERLLKVIEVLSEQMKAADEELEELTKSHPICRRLMTVPGVGPVTAATFWATLDEVKRFKTAHAVESYLESSSGVTVQRLGITRAGSTRTRVALVEAAWSAWRTRPKDPMVSWARAIAERRPKQVAVVALARKMAGILFALWRDGTTYNPEYRTTQT